MPQKIERSTRNRTSAHIYQQASPPKRHKRLWQLPEESLEQLCHHVHVGKGEAFLLALHFLFGVPAHLFILWHIVWDAKTTKQQQQQQHRQHEQRKSTSHNKNKTANSSRSSSSSSIHTNETRQSLVRHSTNELLQNRRVHESCKTPYQVPGTSQCHHKQERSPATNCVNASLSKLVAYYSYKRNK